MDTQRLAEAIHWEMSPEEVKALKLTLLWEAETGKLFPTAVLAKLPKSGDPRKSSLFRFCWKLLRETRGLLQDAEYKLYIHANLQILKANNGRIEPNGLCGNKAWIRWKVWKRLYDRKAAEAQGEPISSVALNPKIVRELDCTKRFLFEKCEGQPTQENLKTFLEKGMFQIWLPTRVSVFYVVLSQWLPQLIDLKVLAEKCGLDLKLYREKVDDDVLRYFRQEYAYEFGESLRQL